MTDRIDDVDGSDWIVFIEWSGRRALSPLSVRALRARQARFRERASDFADLSPDGCAAVDDLAGIVLVVVALILLILLFPILVVTLFALVEVVIVVALALGVLALRTLLGRPWRVVAVSGQGELWSWKQVGWQRATELVSRIEADLSAGAHPSTVPPRDAQPEGLQQLAADAPTHLVESAGVRLAAKLLAVVVIIVVLTILG